VFVFGGLDCLLIPRFRGAGNFLHACGVVLSGPSGGLMIFATEDGQVGSQRGLGVMGRSGHRGLFFEDSYKTVEQLRHPLVQFRGGGP